MGRGVSSTSCVFMSRCTRPGDEDMDLSGDGGSEGGASGGFHSEHSGDSVPGLSDRDDSDDDEGQHDDDNDNSEDDGEPPSHCRAKRQAAIAAQSSDQLLPLTLLARFGLA